MNSLTIAELRSKFKERVHKGPIVVAPGCYDAYSAALATRVGFESIYMTGAGVSVGLLGVPDLGFLTMTEMVETARHIADVTNLPIIADADTGYGGPLNVRRTIREYEKAGVCAIHLEDQEIPKRCGHLEGKVVVSRALMVDRIKAAVDARSDPNFMIIARTDSRATHGLPEALDRGRLCAEAGADVVFIEAPESREEMDEICRTFQDVPLFINRGGGKKTPWLSVDELDEMGFRIVIFPGETSKAAGKAMLDVLSAIKETGNTYTAQDMMMSFEERFEIMGLSRYREIEARYPGDNK